MLSFENVDVSVSGTHILKNINVKFNKGEITTIIGPNGCGKTTLLSCLNSSAKVTAGHIMIDGTDFLRIPYTCSNENSFISIAEKVFNSDGTSDSRIRTYLDTFKFKMTVFYIIKHRLRKSELRNTIS